MRRHTRVDLWAVLVIALGALLRLIHLGETPSVLEYDEAANVILAGEIARGQATPVFIRPYTGKEALYFYLAAGTMKLAGVRPFALRLTSAALGILALPLTCFCVRQLFASTRLGETERRWLALWSAALVAVSYWQVNLSRLGYRAIVLPPLLAFTIGFLVRGWRTQDRVSLSLAGIGAGLSAYTYSSVRVFPILLLILWAGLLIGDRRRWRARVLQLATFGLPAVLVFAPLGIFFLRNPETFTVRLQQVSVFSPTVHKGDPWGTLGHTILQALGMFTSSGDHNPLYNFPGKPVFDPVLGALFYLGLLVCLWGAFVVVGADGHSRRDVDGSVPGTTLTPRLPYLILLAWLLVMMVPNVLSASGVPHNLRAMALVPAVFIVTGLGLATVVRWLVRAASRFSLHPGPSWVLPATGMALLLGCEGALTYYQYAHVWASSAAPYYKGNQALVAAAALVDQHPEADPYVATYFHQHATLAVAAHRYGAIRWLSGRTLILPPPGARPALLIYDHTNPVDPLLRDHYLPPDLLLHRELGPDGDIGFEAYWLDAARRPSPSPQYPAHVDLGHTLVYLGHDLNAPARSGDLLDVTLYLQVERAVDRDDWALFVHLVGDLGFRWGDQTFFDYPSKQWRPGEILILRRQIPIAAGAPPGEYTLDIGAFSASLDARLPLLNSDGQMAGTVVAIGPIPVGRASAPPAELPPIQEPQQVAFGDELTYLGSDRDRSDLRPGETLALTLYWRAEQEIEQPYTVSTWLASDPGDILLWRGDPVHGRYPFSRWQEGEFVRDRYALRLPLDAPAGDYDLRLSLLQKGGSPLPVRAEETVGVSTTWTSLGTIHVRPSDRLWEPPPFEHPVSARLGSQVELLGYDLDRTEARPGDTLHLTLVWRCQEVMDFSYTVFTHLLDASDQIRGQKDSPPLEGTYPTTLWVPGEVVVDPYPISIASDAPPGKYVIEVGMYDPHTMQRLPVQDPTGATGDRILLGNVQVNQP